MKCSFVTCRITYCKSVLETTNVEFSPKC